jgi:hypothetical protein
LSFFRHAAKLGETHGVDYSKFQHFEEANIHGGPRYMHEEFCIISDRPTVLKVDDQNRPHCEDGPFCRWSDGSALYSWHGTKVPAEWIEHKDRLDPRVALTHENLELRRAAAEIVGWKRVLQHLRAKPIDVDDNPEVGTLLEVDLPDAPGSRFLQVRCGTGRDFVLAVPNTLKTAREANAWGYQLDPSEMELEVRT